MAGKKFNKDLVDLIAKESNHGSFVKKLSQSNFTHSIDEFAASRNIRKSDLAKQMGCSKANITTLKRSEYKFASFTAGKEEYLVADNGVCSEYLVYELGF